MKMDPVTARLLVEKASELTLAQEYEASVDRPYKIQVLTIDLSTQRLSTDPYKIGFQFQSVFVRDASDTATEVSMRPITRDDLQGAVPLRKNDALDFGQTINEAYLHWAAQTGKSVTLVFFLDAQFRSGSQLSQNAGGISINDGSAFTTARVDLTAATATAVVAANTSRKVASIQNNTGSDVWFGNASVANSGANLGIKVGAGDVFEWRNTAALYGYSVGGGSGNNGLLVLEET